MAQPELSIVIPVYNEASIVAQAAEELCAALDERGLDYEILFAENGSKDSTPQILQGLCDRNPRLRWFHSERPNYGFALKAGLEQARGELVICDEIDLCDVTFYDQALPLLRRRGADMVGGSKTPRGARRHRPRLRRLATRAHKGPLRFTPGFNGTDTP